MATKTNTSDVLEGNDVTSSSDAGAYSIRFQDIKGFDPIPDGMYDVVVREAKPGMSQANLPKWEIVFVIEEAEDESLNGRKLFDNISFAPNALWRVKAFLLALGFPEDFDGEITPTDVIGERCVVTVATETTTKINKETGKPYEPRPRIKAFAPTGSNVGIDDVL